MATELNGKDLKEYVVTGKFDIASSIKPDKDSAESKTVTLRFNLEKVPLSDLLSPALSSKRITWQNNVGRPKFDKIKDRSIIDVDFTSPGKKIVSEEEKIEMLAEQFMKAGLKRAQALEMATKAVKNPELIEE